MRVVQSDIIQFPITFDRVRRLALHKIKEEGLKFYDGGSNGKHSLLGVYFNGDGGENRALDLVFQPYRNSINVTLQRGDATATVVWGTESSVLARKATKVGLDRIVGAGSVSRAVGFYNQMLGL